MVSTFSHEDETDDEDILAEKRECPVCVAPTTSRLIVKRRGHSITRKIPKPVVLVDTREQFPLSFAHFSNWIAETKNPETGCRGLQCAGDGTSTDAGVGFWIADYKKSSFFR